MASYNYTFTSGDTVTPTKLNSARTVSEIVNADISATAAIAGTKVAPAFGAQDITVSAANRSITNTGNFALSFGTNNTERVKIQSDGSVMFNPTGVVYSNTFSATNSQTWLTNNATAGDAYLTSDAAQRYRMLTAVGHIWETAVSGTAGGAISWVERMRIDASGRVGIGTSSPDSVLHVLAGANAGLRVGFDNTSVNYYDADTQVFRSINGTERMRIDANGSVGIGTASPSSRLHIAGDLTVSSATTATAATAGAETLPANPVGFLVVSINGTSRKIPYYAT
jgi:hypothetical protein